MKVLICGSRDWSDEECIRRVVDGLPHDAIVINGKARGADKLARFHAIARGLFTIDVPVVGPQWRRHGKGAGHIRNHIMLDLGPELVVAFQVNGSNGTQGTIDEARRRGIPVEVHTA